MSKGELKPKCQKCGDDRYIPYGCCSGRECGCMGMAIGVDNCPECNPDGTAEPSEGLKESMPWEFMTQEECREHQSRRARQ